MHYFCKCVVHLLSLVIASPALALIVTLGPGASTVEAGADSDDADPYAENFAYPTSLPDTGAAGVSEGTNTSTTEYDLSDSALTIRFDHSRDATERARSFGYASIYFAVSDDVDYVLGGTYATNDPDGRQTIHFSATVFDETLGLNVYTSVYDSRYTPNESFTLGQFGGDTIYYEYGALSGTLLAGHEYRLSVDAAISARPDGSTFRADATGLTSLSFVPEPSTGLLVSAGLLGITGWRRVRG